MLKKLLEVIISAAARIGQREVKKINSLLLSRLLPVQIKASEQILVALIDKDKDNDKQLVEILKRNFSLTLTEGTDLAKIELAKIKDEELRTALITYIDGLEEVLLALLDDNKENEQQLKVIWNKRKAQIIGSSIDIVTDKIADVVRKKVDDAEIAAIIISVIQSLDLFIKEPAEAVKAA